MDTDCSQLRLLSQNARALAEQSAGADRSAKAKQLADQGALLFLKLKADARTKAFEIEAAREETSKAKQQLETSHLALQNLQYEKQHYEKVGLPISLWQPRASPMALMSVTPAVCEHARPRLVPPSMHIARFGTSSSVSMHALSVPL